MALTPFSQLPLQTSTYLSRISSFMDRRANYVLSGFRPGFALQAAELNELQEQVLTNQTLTNRCQNTWKDLYTTANPFWDGTTPYNPSLLTVSGAAGTITVTATKGWYYLVDAVFAGTGVLNSGFGYWINLPQDLSISVSFGETSTSVTRYGFTYTVSDINAATDDTLYDQSNAANANMTVPGANRIKIDNIQLVKYSSSLSKFSTLFGAIRTSQSQFTLNWPYANYTQVFATGTN